MHTTAQELTAVMSGGVRVASTALEPGSVEHTVGLVLEALHRADWNGAVAASARLDPGASPLAHWTVAVALAWCRGGRLAGPVQPVEPRDPLAGLASTLEASALLALGDLTTVAGVVDRTLATVGALEPAERAWLHVLAARAAVLDNRLADAGRHVAAAQGGTDARVPRLAAEALSMVLAAHAGVGQEIDAWCAGLVAGHSRPVGYPDALVFLLAAGAQTILDNPDAAVALAEHGAGGPLLPHLPPALRPYVVDLQVEIAVRDGDLDGADEILRRCEGLDLASLPMARSSLAHAAALVAARRGDFDRAAVMAALAAQGARSGGSHGYRTRAVLMERLAAAAAGGDPGPAAWLPPGTDPAVVRWAQRQQQQVRRVLDVPPLEVMEQLDEDQQTVARLTGLGWTVPQIAEVLGLDGDVVAAHLERVLVVVGARSHEGLARQLAAEDRPRRTPDADLTPKQWSVAELVATGITNERVASTLGVSVKAVEKHLTAVFRRLGLTRRTELRDWVRTELGHGRGPAARP